MVYLEHLSEIKKKIPQHEKIHFASLNCSLRFLFFSIASFLRFIFYGLMFDT